MSTVVHISRRGFLGSVFSAGALVLAAQVLPQDLERAGRGWHTTVKTQRLGVAKVLRENPSLRRTVPDELADAYAVARIESYKGEKAARNLQYGDIRQVQGVWTP